MNCVVVDFSSLYHRSAHAYEALRWIVDGVSIPTGSMYGSVRKVSELIQKYNSCPICIMIEPESNDTRYKINSEYKNNRIKKPDDFMCVYEDTLRILSLFPQVAVFSSSESGEADDVIASFVHSYKEKFDKFYIYSADNDLLQIASSTDLKNRMYYIKDNGEFEFWKYCQEKHGVTPDKILLYRSIIGDSSDGLKPVIPRFQKKHVVDILGSCDSIEDIISHSPESYTGSKRLKFDKLIEHKDNLIKNYDVMKLHDVKLEYKHYSDANSLAYYVNRYGMTSFNIYFGAR